MVRAAVCVEVGADRAEIRDVELVGPGPGQVRLRVRATGVCHSDLSAMNGTMPQATPCVLGHEAAGEVAEVGEGVTSVSPGDRVIVCWTPPCGGCRACLRGQPYLCTTVTRAGLADPPYRLDGQPCYALAGTAGTFIEEAILAEQAVVGVGPDVPFDIGALVGCGVMTGVGSVLNVAQVEPGARVAVIGCGGVGISVIQGAKVARAETIVAVDPVARKRDWAARFGATQAVGPDEVADARKEVTGGEGFDYVFEVVGSSATIRQAYELTRRGGTTVVVGLGRTDDFVRFNAFELFFMDRTIKSSVYGGADVRRDFHRMLDLWRDGSIDLDGMITGRYPLDEVNEAFDALRAGEAIRSVVELPA